MAQAMGELIELPDSGWRSAEAVGTDRGTDDTTPRKTHPDEPMLTGSRPRR